MRLEATLPQQRGGNQQPFDALAFLFTREALEIERGIDDFHNCIFIDLAAVEHGFSPNEVDERILANKNVNCD